MGDILYFLCFFAVILIMLDFSYEAKIKKMESKIRKLEKNLKGEKSMSKILSELINKKCVLVSKDYLFINSKRELECTVLDVDDEWIKFNFTDKEGVIKTQLLRIEEIVRVNFIEN